MIDSVLKCHAFKIESDYMIYTLTKSPRQDPGAIDPSFAAPSSSADAGKPEEKGGKPAGKRDPKPKPDPSKPPKTKTPSQEAKSVLPSDCNYFLVYR